MLSEDRSGVCKRQPKLPANSSGAAYPADDYHYHQQQHQNSSAATSPAAFGGHHDADLCSGDDAAGTAEHGDGRRQGTSNGSFADHHQIVIVIRHGERADEHTKEAMLNPPLTANGYAAVGRVLVPDLVSHLRERYDSSVVMDAAYLAREFVVVSSPFQRCVETATALLENGIGSANAVKVSHGGVAPLIDARLSEVFGPIRIKADVSQYVASTTTATNSPNSPDNNNNYSSSNAASTGAEAPSTAAGGGGNNGGFAGVFAVPNERYLSSWCAERRGGAAVSPVSSASVQLPEWGESLLASNNRYHRAMCEIPSEVAAAVACSSSVGSSSSSSTASSPRHVILVSHGDMLNGVMSGLYPMRTLFSVEFLGFAMMERRRVTVPSSGRLGFNPRYFRMTSQSGLMWINDGEDAPEENWDRLTAAEEAEAAVAMGVGKRTRCVEDDEENRGAAGGDTRRVESSPGSMGTISASSPSAVHAVSAVSDDASANPNNSAQYETRMEMERVNAANTHTNDSSAYEHRHQQQQQQQQPIHYVINMQSPLPPNHAINNNTTDNNNHACTAASGGGVTNRLGYSAGGTDDKRAPRESSFFSSCDGAEVGYDDDEYADGGDDGDGDEHAALNKQRHSNNNRNTNNNNSAAASTNLIGIPLSSVVVLVAGYSVAAGLHLAAFAVASAANDRAAWSFGWAVGVAGSLIILLMLIARHLIGPIRRLANRMEDALLCIEGAGASSSSSSSSSPMAASSSSSLPYGSSGGATSRPRGSSLPPIATLVLRLLVRLVFFLVLVVGVDVAVTYIVGAIMVSQDDGRNNKDDAHMLWEGLVDSAGPFILLVACLIAWLVTEGVLAPLARLRNANSGSNRSSRTRRRPSSSYPHTTSQGGSANNKLANSVPMMAEGQQHGPTMGGH